MARRFSAPYQSEPFSGLATWARRLAVFAGVVALVSILVVRFGFLEIKPALMTFFGALACAGLGALESGFTVEPWPTIRSAAEFGNCIGVAINSIAAGLSLARPEWLGRVAPFRHTRPDEKDTAAHWNFSFFLRGRQRSGRSLGFLSTRLRT